MNRQIPARNYSKARKLRAEMTLPEVLLWKQLKGQPAGIKFRRQHPVGRYVLDFYCPAAKLGIEIDGLSHDGVEPQDRDAARDHWLVEQGIRIVRIPAAEVLRSVADTAEAILALCRGAD